MTSPSNPKNQAPFKRAEIPCGICGHAVLVTEPQCFHCAVPLGCSVPPKCFPNVNEAELPDNELELDKRYASALTKAKARGCDAVLQAFEHKIATESKAAIARSMGEAERLASSDKQLYSTYYQLIDAEQRIPDGDIWDALRRLADELIFPGHKEKVRFAALSLDGRGLINYGEVTMVLGEKMIAHRASVFEKNTAMFFVGKVIEESLFREAIGHRAAWKSRARLCVAKLSGALDQTTPEDAFAGILLRNGKDSGSDDYVEVHIWGPISVRSLVKIIVHKANPLRSRKGMKALDEKLNKNYQVDLEY